MLIETYFWNMYKSFEHLLDKELDKEFFELSNYM